MGGLACWAVFLVLVIALLWPGSPAGQAVHSVGGALKGTIMGAGS